MALKLFGKSRRDCWLVIADCGVAEVADMCGVVIDMDDGQTNRRLSKLVLDLPTGWAQMHSAPKL